MRRPSFLALQVERVENDFSKNRFFANSSLFLFRFHYQVTFLSFSITSVQGNNNKSSISTRIVLESMSRERKAVAVADCLSRLRFKSKRRHSKFCNSISLTLSILYSSRHRKMPESTLIYSPTDIGGIHVFILEARSLQATRHFTLIFQASP